MVPDLLILQLTAVLVVDGAICPAPAIICKWG